MKYEAIKEMVTGLLDAPDSQLDKTMVEKIKQWSNPPKAIEILEVADACVHCALASDFVVNILDGIYIMVCKLEGTTHDEVVKQATWRSEEERS